MPVCHDVPVHDLIGVGFGPSNLALAIAVSELDDRTDAAVSAHFLERQPRFGWHRGMLIEDATMQVSFLKDLVTMRNPVSEFSFLAYLHERGRLVDFINHKRLFPLRVEFHDYLEWAAAGVDHLVSYGSEVVAVTPVADLFHVRLADGRVFHGRNVVLATGLRPRLPEGIACTDRIWHNHELLHRIEELTDPARCVVVGSGQSAAEVTAFLHDRFPAADVCSVFTRYGYSPSDDSPFANRIFDPDGVDAFYSAPTQVKRQLMDYHGNTNYSVVDLDLIDDLYHRCYREKVGGEQRLRIFNASRITEVVDSGDGVRVVVESLTSGEKTVLDADVVVYSTGYLPADPAPLLGDLAQHCHTDEQGRWRIERDYRLSLPDSIGGVYLQGGTEHSHGITASLLSATAVRAGEILRSILDRRDVDAQRRGDSAVDGARNEANR
ncbi:L-ornithine N5-oxygenase [Nocardia alba]|uniref:L-lysine N6-monooxygenase MbtG n=1 Tax=Nocardia alba TaxID=225051 RepID=A0A4R1FJN4_9NOCA|nr:lysine N(6)-hydroxylase/L-ornithine N(5)-oxygenase family protein [Nocardia alba]TCJ94957.1 L-ornithine N5-oxygenase [Nocardia alba]